MMEYTKSVFMTLVAVVGTLLLGRVANAGGVVMVDRMCGGVANVNYVGSRAARLRVSAFPAVMKK